MNQKLAIIGSSSGQRPLYIKAQAMGLQTIGFAWANGATCLDVTDKFYDISITEKDKIVELCKAENVCGVVANASTLTVETAFYIAEKLGLNCTPFETIQKIKDKNYVRQATNDIEGLSHPIFSLINQENFAPIFPCIVKPITGASKKGVSYVTNEKELNDAIDYSKKFYKNTPILTEEFISGIEVSVESISYHGIHYVIQVTDKDNTGAPHFVEIGHHQPSLVSDEVRKKIDQVIPKILNAVHFINGATHIELKIREDGRIYLIEINPRGGGDEISNTLVELSTNVDYVKAMIEVACDKFQSPNVHNTHYAGIYYLCKQTQSSLPFFKKIDKEPWLVRKQISSYELSEATGNRDRNGFFVYCADKKITLE